MGRPASRLGGGVRRRGAANWNERGGLFTPRHAPALSTLHLHQVPQVSIEILEDGDRPVLFLPR